MMEAAKLDEKYFPIGSLIPMSDNEGNQLRGRVLEITPELMKMDL